MNVAKRRSPRLANHIHRLNGSLPLLEVISSFLWANEIALLRRVNVLFWQLKLSNQTYCIQGGWYWGPANFPGLDITTIVASSADKLFFSCTFDLKFPRLKHLVLDARQIDHANFYFSFPDLLTLHFIGWNAGCFQFQAPRLERLDYDGICFIPSDVEKLRTIKKTVINPAGCTVCVTRSNFLLPHLDRSVDTRGGIIQFTLNQLT